MTTCSRSRRSVQPVVVAVAPDGTDHAVLSWAAREAARRGSRLVVTTLPGARGHDAEARRTGPDALARAAARAREEEPGLGVRVDRSASGGLHHLLALSEGAALVVLGTEAQGLDEPPEPSAPLLEQLAVDAGCPVVVLTPQALQGPAARHDVVSGWARGRSGRHALVLAASEAAARAAWLSVAAAVLPDDAEVARTLDRPGHESELLEAVARAERDHPRLVVDLLHRNGPVGAELARAAERADLLVIACRPSDQPWSNRPGSVAGALLRTAPCPLVLVGPAAHGDHPVSDRRLEGRDSRRAARGSTQVTGPSR